VSTDESQPSPLVLRAMRSLAKRAHSRAELRAKLERSGGPGEVQEVLDRLEELRLLNDEDYAYDFALRRMTRDGWGPGKVLAALHGRQIPADIAEAALDRARSAAGDDAILADFVERHCGKAGWPSDRRGIRSLIDRLRRKGFAEDQIHRCLRERLPAGAWRNYDEGD